MKKAVIGVLFCLLPSILINLNAPALGAEDFPNKQITMLCGFSAGGGTDAVARKLGQEMEKVLGQPVLVVNKTGGGGLVSIKALVASPTDGYTINMFPILNGFIQKYFRSMVSWVDPLEKLSCIGVVNADYWGIAVQADTPLNTVPELVAYVKEHPEVKVGDSGQGAGYHWGWEQFMDTTGLKLSTVAYKGTSLGLRALAGKEIFAVATSAPEAASLAGAGLIKVLGISAPERHPKYPKIPTLKEQGVDMVYGIYRAVVAPVGTPEPVRQKLAAAVKVAYDSKDYQQFLQKTGYGATYMGPQEGQEFFQKLDSTIKRLMDKAGVLRKEYRN